MKNLFKLSDFYFGLFVIVLALASCSKRENAHSSSYHWNKLEKLSAELENNKATNSLNSIPEDEERKIAEQSSVPVSEKILTSATPEKWNKPVPAFKGMRESKMRDKTHKFTNETSVEQSKVSRGGLTQRMKLGIILAAVGLLVALLVPWPVYIVGVVVFIIGVVLIIMELVNY